ncbi:DUF480 domain-containing protein [Ammonicoccus fulvus]|uniref:DUF480 domain-containing protein n=1 Tax=Ammonicoccus fulvus TaxID=3138240 RepID=A0ABZ3FUI3_9ACTN
MVEPMTTTGGPLPELSAIEQRVLGALMEKQRTVPASYPLSLNGLRTACNQTSSREPVTDYDDKTLEEQARELKHRDLVKVVWAGKGSRTLKYHQLLTDRLGLAEDEAALITVLLLRGAQAPGELKARTERLIGFADRTEVEDCLARMADRGQPLVRQLERRVGQHDRRWIHLLGPVAGEDSVPVPTEPVVDREVVLTDGPAARDARVRAAYDATAEAYAGEFGDELAGQPFEQWLLAHVAELGEGPVADVGCGPGYTTALLAEAGADVTGFDLSPAMVEIATAEQDGVRFEVGDFTRLLRPPAAAAWGTIVAWYSLVHLAPSELPGTVAGFARILAPGGWLVIGLQIGGDVHRVEEFHGIPIELDFVRHEVNDVLGAVAAAGLEVIERYVRGPVPGETPAKDRFYVLARRPLQG